MESAKDILAKVAAETATARTGSETSDNSPSSKPKLVTANERAVCPHCMEYLEGKVSIAEHMAWERTTDRQTDRLLEALVGCGVLKEHLSARLADFSDKVQRKCRYFLESGESQGVIVSGSPGTGKTRLAVALCREITVAEKRFRYTHARAFFRRLWNTYRDDAEETEEQAIGMFCQADFLVLDDLGHEGKVSDAVVGALHEVLTQRHGNYKPTIITTNLGIEEIASRYDSSIASRLKAWLAVVLTGADRRLA